MSSCDVFSLVQWQILIDAERFGRVVPEVWRHLEVLLPPSTIYCGFAGHQTSNETCDWWSRKHHLGSSGHIFRWMPYMAPSCHRNSKSPALFPQELLEISSITRAKRWSRKEIERKSTCYNNIPRRAFLSLETLNHLKIPFNTASSRDTSKLDLFRNRASWLALSFTKSGCWLQISKSFATISSHASFRSSSSCASVRLQNAKSTAIGSTETGLNRTC